MGEPASLFEQVEADDDPVLVGDDGGGDGGAATNGGTWLPTELARGPWDPGALHGGPVAALLARAVERATSRAPGPGMVTRFTLELLRPVPVRPLVVEAAVTRPGRKVQIAEGSVTADGQAVARCRAVWLRVDPAAMAEEALPRHVGSAPFPPPDDAPVVGGFRSAYRGFHNGGAELRFARGGLEDRGPAAVWVRLAVPVLPGEAPTPLQRTVAAADFGNGVSAVVPADRYRFINPDLTVSCARAAAGEWVAIEAETTLGAPGIGLAQSVLWDTGREGPIGRAVQCLLVEPR